jgi:predicted DNA-binding transcriptional regulator AlpA
MKMISTHEAAKRLGLHFTTLAHYVSVGKVPAPAMIQIGSRTVHAWSEEEIENVRRLLPKIANGRKTRYQKLRKQQKAPAGAPVPHKKSKPEKK